MAERNIKLVIEYKGTAFSGWQIQADRSTVQGEITEAIRQTTGKDVNVLGAGRTDAGVHALGQAANFIIDHHIEPEKYRDALNYYLPDDIRIREAVGVPLSFHARKDAKYKRYRYVIGRERSALYRDYRWELGGRGHPSASLRVTGKEDRVTEEGERVSDTRGGLLRRVEWPLQVELLRQAAEVIAGEHDFAPFCVVASRKEDNRCVIHHAKWREIGPLLVFEIRGNRFLHNMVRSLVGAMVNLATTDRDRHPDNLTLARFADIIHTPSDHRIVFTAPAQGLYLVSVHY